MNEKRRWELENGKKCDQISILPTHPNKICARARKVCISGLKNSQPLDRTAE